MEIIRACEYITLEPSNSNNSRKEISEIFVDGFYQWLKFFSKDKLKLTNAFEHIFNLDVFYIAINNDQIAGITACTDGKVKCVRLEKSHLRKHLGFFMGSFTYFMLKKQFEEKPYPFEITNGMGTIEFVSTSPKHRGKGVATEIIKHIISSEPYAEYVLEVADTNTNAVKLYEKLGFTEFMSIKEKHSKQSGVNYLVYMKLMK